MTVPQLVSYCEEHPDCDLYGGVDVGREKSLFVFTVAEKIVEVMWDRLRIELENRPFSEMEECLHPILRLSQLKRCCFDAGGPGAHLHERMKDAFGWKIEGLKFTAPLKEKLASPFVPILKIADSASSPTNRFATIFALSKREPPPAAISVS